MGQAVDRAQQERELTKQALEADVNRLEARVRAELDWRARLRRDGARYAAMGAGALLVVGALVALRLRLRRRDKPSEQHPASLDEVAAELKQLRRDLERKKGSTPLWQRAALGALTAAASAGGTAAARQMMGRSDDTTKGNERPHAG